MPRRVSTVSGVGLRDAHLPAGQSFRPPGNGDSVSPRPNRVARWRAECGSVETVVFQSAGSELVKVGCLTRPAKGTGPCEPYVIKQDDQYVGGAFGRAQRLDWRKLCVGVFGIVGREADVRLGWDGKDAS